MTVPAYRCSTAAFEGDTWHEQRCPWAAARRPQVEALPGTSRNDPEQLAPAPYVSGQHRTGATDAASEGIDLERPL